MNFSSSYDDELELAIDIAKIAGDIMLQYFNGEQQRETKDDGTPVTIADKMINRMAIEEIAKRYPADGIIGEEESSTKDGTKRLWYCDPIDGTKPFTWGVPTAVFSLGLVVDNKPTLGVILDPFLNNLFIGVMGKGSYCNDVKLHVSDENLLQGTVAVTSSPERLVASPPKYITNLITAGIRTAPFSGGIYKSTLVARGRTVAYIESKVRPHDLAAIDVIVTEAGGKVSTIEGYPLDYAQGFESAIVSNGVVHDELVALAR